ncbi:MAG: PH domain-containing protein [Planctomycetota bacterium]|nr:PH domain-containing protein [Planctomycetota bacterium]
MKQAIAGVAPPQLSEVTVMVTWPSIASTGLGQFLGRLYLIGYKKSWLPIGAIIALLSIPIALPLYMSMLFPPWSMKRYRLTNRRVTIERGLAGKVQQYVDLDRFDTIDVVVQPGQAWYPAGDLVFKKGATETFRLHGVLRPDTFRATCMKAHQSYVGVKKALAYESR